MNKMTDFINYYATVGKNYSAVNIFPRNDES